MSARGGFFQQTQPNIYDNRIAAINRTASATRPVNEWRLAHYDYYHPVISGTELVRKPLTISEVK